ncbi:MAG: sporulation protein YunB [Candidatus Faecousia sp.]|nr:sporulation protein YunB [Clostridiales bacterium]MDD6297903.1 sporulation protein YunB [Bacillota bacterium]MDD7341354.1 sporulation protein YunB [Bacillota bacterium]MDY2810402.1 sporulation protein YunB [Candidatus Faecousia sp.]
MKRVLRRILCLTAVLALLAVAVLLVLRTKYRKVLMELAQTQMKNVTSDLINDAVDREIAEGTIQYDRLVYFEKDLEGRITALKTNMGEINRLKTETLALINQEILDMDSSALGVPIGSLVLPEVFAGRGFSIPIEILTIRNSDASFSSCFSQAGINQTLQQMKMDVFVDVTVLILGSTESFTVTSQVVVAETIIVGQVPNTYLQTGGNYGTQRENGPDG